jgi:hypothetical protein
LGELRDFLWLERGNPDQGKQWGWVRAWGAAVLRPYMNEDAHEGAMGLNLNPAIWEAIAATGWRRIVGGSADRW